MTAKEFTHHIYKNIWKHIIKQKEYDNYWENADDPEYYPDDFITDAVTSLINSLKENFPFSDAYKNVIGSINQSERELIIEFMMWFTELENKTGNDIYYMVESGCLDLRPLDKIADFVKTTTLTDIATSSTYRKDQLAILYKAIEKFTSASKSLTERRKGKPTIPIDDEYDMQDILHVILKPHFPSIKIEEVVSGKDSGRFLKIDFVLSKIKVAIECKCIRDKTHAKNLSKEINDDIQTYNEHQDCSHLIFFIYDKNLQIMNPDMLEENYSKKQTFDGKDMLIDLKIRPKN